MTTRTVTKGSMSDPRPALEVGHLSAGYGDLPVLRDVSFELSGSGVACVMGRNGVGKTTLFRALMGLLPFCSGTVRLDDDDLSGEKPHRRARAGLAWLPQDDCIFAGLTVDEHLEIAGAGKDLAAGLEEVKSLFPLLFERLEQPAQTLSGGERKMLGIAQAMLRRPKVLFLDEPTEGVAPMVIERIQEAIIELAAHYPIVLAEQNVDTALAVGDHAYVFEKGAIVEQGTPQRLHADGVLQERLGI
jgi:branched-chain amino acid transport system ATP-binding protein